MLQLVMCLFNYAIERYSVSMGKICFLLVFTIVLAIVPIGYGNISHTTVIVET